ncbi:Eukaryotic protein of unknown function (DUF953) domain containing protein [Amanita muscaria]
MPLLTADSSLDSVALTQVPDQFIVFYSSIVDGHMWCPDCRDVDQLIQDTFKSEGSPSALIVYVGDRTQWKSPSNIYRAEPWNIQSIPTIVKLKNGSQEGRLILNEINERLQPFIGSDDMKG